MTTTFGATLKDILAAHRLSQNKAAEMADYDHSYISRLITGTRMPTREFIDCLANNCGFTDEEWQRLLVAAGFLPKSAMAVLQEPELEEAAAALHDPAIPRPYRENLRRQISALVGITRQMAA
jgi:transcriptional regulator with XRE-family HTH domain